MNLKITTSLPLTIGGSNVSNLICDITEHCKVTDTGGYAGPVDIRTWLNKDAYTTKKAVVTALSNNQEINNVNIALTQAEFLAANLPVTIYTKVAEAMQVKFGITVVVELV